MTQSPSELGAATPEPTSHTCHDVSYVNQAAHPPKGGRPGARNIDADSIKMLNRIPRNIPPLAEILADIGNPSPRELARALGYSERSTREWLRRNAAPRPVLIALFWLTRWGVSSIDADAHNLIQMHASMATAQTRRADELAVAVAMLEKMGTFGAANSPIMLAAHRHRASNPPARPSSARTLPRQEPVTTGALVRAGHLKTVPP